MTDAETPTEGKAFDDAMGAAAAKADELVELLPKLRAAPDDDALWKQAADTIGAMAQGLRDIGVSVTQHSDMIETLARQIRLGEAP